MPQSHVELKFDSGRVKLSFSNRYNEWTSTKWTQHVTETLTFLEDATPNYWDRFTGALVNIGYNELFFCSLSELGREKVLKRKREEEGRMS